MNCYICDKVGRLGNYIETQGQIVCGYDSGYDLQEYFIVSGMDLLYGIENDTLICDDCLISLCKEGRVKLDMSNDDCGIGYCNSCNTFNTKNIIPRSANKFPYATIIYFDIENTVLKIQF